MTTFVTLVEANSETGVATGRTLQIREEHWSILFPHAAVPVGNMAYASTQVMDLAAPFAVGG